MRNIYFILSLIFLMIINNSHAGVKYGYIHNISIYGSNMGALEKVLKPGVESITRKINIQAMDYGFQGYKEDLILFFLDNPDIEIIAKTLNQNGHWVEGEDLENGTLKIVITELNKQPKTITEYFVKRISDSALEIVGAMGGVTSAQDITFFGLEKLSKKSMNNASKIWNLANKTADYFNIKDKANELIQKKLKKNKKILKINEKLFALPLVIFCLVLS